MNQMPKLIKLIQTGKINTNFLFTHKAPLNDIMRSYDVFGNKKENCLNGWLPSGNNIQPGKWCDRQPICRTILKCSLILCISHRIHALILYLAARFYNNGRFFLFSLPYWGIVAINTWFSSSHSRRTRLRPEYKTGGMPPPGSTHCPAI